MTYKSDHVVCSCYYSRIAHTSQSEPPTTIMNPAAAGAQEDESTLSSNDTDPLKLRWSKLKAEEKCPIPQEVIS
jgi:hypothetical protein